MYLWPEHVNHDFVFVCVKYPSSLLLYVQSVVVVVAFPITVLILPLPMELESHSISLSLSYPMCHLFISILFLMIYSFFFSQPMVSLFTKTMQ